MVGCIPEVLSDAIILHFYIFSCTLSTVCLSPPLYFIFFGRVFVPPNSQCLSPMFIYPPYICVLPIWTFALNV